MDRLIASGNAAPGAKSSPRWLASILLVLVALTSGCETTPSDPGSQYQASTSDTSSGSAEEFFIVDCLLPGQVRQLGGQFTYVTQRRAIKTAQSDCEIRGGEYVAYDRADYSTSLKIWLPLAQAGDATAQTYVGEIYEKGLGLRADHAMAAQWYEKAVQQGHSRAQINLGNLYIEQKMVREAMESLHRALTIAARRPADPPWGPMPCGSVRASF